MKPGHEIGKPPLTLMYPDGFRVVGYCGTIWLRCSAYLKVPWWII